MDTIKSAIEWFIGHCADHRKLSHHTLKAYRHDLKNFCLFASVTPVDGTLLSVDRNMVQRWLGQAKDIANGTSKHKAIVACIGFYDFVKMQWRVSGRGEPELNGVFKDAVARRNRIAHQLLAEFYQSQLSIVDALIYLEESKKRLLELRDLVVTADTLSSRMGSIASDGSSQPRFKTTP